MTVRPGIPATSAVAAALRTAFVAMLVAGLVIGCGASGTTPTPASFTIVAEDYTLTPSTLEVPAGVPLTVVLENRDASIPHAISVYQGPYRGEPLFEGEWVYGVATVTYAIPALEAGQYTFGCPLHDDEGVVVFARD